MRDGDANLLVIPMIETVDAVEAIEEICALEQVAMLVFVAGELAFAMGEGANMHSSVKVQEDEESEAVLSAVGQRLRTLRRSRGLTLAELALQTGISESTLSRLESGRRRATLELLSPLARAYRVAMDELIGVPHTGDPRIHLRPIRRAGRVFIPLTRRAGGMQAYKMLIPASMQPGGEDPDPKIHEGYEWLYVLNGRLRLVLGDQDLTLSAGEAAEFDTHVRHWLGAAGEEPVELLILFGRQGERTHLRAHTT